MVSLAVALAILHLPYVASTIVLAVILKILNIINKNYFYEKYAYHLLYSMDQYMNAVLLGKPDDTISSRAALALNSGRPKWFVKPFSYFVDFLFLVILGERNHVKNSYRDLTGDQELWSWEKSKWQNTSK